MADKTISQVTATNSLADTDMLLIEKSSGVTYHITVSDIKKSVSGSTSGLSQLSKVDKDDKIIVEKSDGTRGYITISQLINAIFGDGLSEDTNLDGTEKIVVTNSDGTVMYTTITNLIQTINISSLDDANLDDDDMLLVGDSDDGKNYKTTVGDMTQRAIDTISESGMFGNTATTYFLSPFDMVDITNVINITDYFSDTEHAIAGKEYVANVDLVMWWACSNASMNPPIVSINNSPISTTTVSNSTTWVGVNRLLTTVVVGDSLLLERVFIPAGTIIKFASSNSYSTLSGTSYANSNIHIAPLTNTIANGTPYSYDGGTISYSSTDTTKLISADNFSVDFNFNNSCSWQMVFNNTSNSLANSVAFKDVFSIKTYLKNNINTYTTNSKANIPYTIGSGKSSVLMTGPIFKFGKQGGQLVYTRTTICKTNSLYGYNPNITLASVEIPSFDIIVKNTSTFDDLMKEVE